jgi:hypothetical protein
MQQITYIFQMFACYFPYHTFIYCGQKSTIAKLTHGTEPEIIFFSIFLSIPIEWKSFKWKMLIWIRLAPNIIYSLFCVMFCFWQTGGLDFISCKIGDITEKYKPELKSSHKFQCGDPPPGNQRMLLNSYWEKLVEWQDLLPLMCSF